MFTFLAVESVNEDGGQVKIKSEKLLQLFVEIIRPPGFEMILSNIESFL